MDNISTLNKPATKAKDASRLFLELFAKAEITDAESKQLAELYAAAQKEFSTWKMSAH